MMSEREVPPQSGDPLLRLVQREGTFWVPVSVSGGVGWAPPPPWVLVDMGQGVNTLLS